MKKEIKWLNGLKGISALLIYFHHIVLNFYPAIYYGDGSISKTNTGIDIKLSKESYGILVRGNFFLCLLFTITAFIFAYKRFADLYNGNDNFKVCAKRYIQLLSITLTTGAFYYFLVDVCTLLNINKFSLINELNFIEFIEHNLFYQWFISDTTILSTLWSMKYSFLCAVIALLFSSFSSRDRWYMPIVYIIIGCGT